MNNNAIAARMVYENAVVNIERNFAGVPGFDIRRFKLTQSFLRLEQPCVVGTTLYPFPVLVNQAQPQIFNTEQRLNLQDTFVVSELAFYLAAPTSGTDTTFRPFSYVNQVIFTNVLQMQGFYNGQLSVTVNNDVVIPTWDLFRHYKAPETQQTAAFGAGSPGDQLDFSQDSFYSMEPNLTIIGAKNYQFRISLPAPPTAVHAGSRIGIWMRGILAQNSTVVS